MMQVDKDGNAAKYTVVGRGLVCVRLFRTESRLELPETLTGMSEGLDSFHRGSQVPHL